MLMKRMGKAALAGAAMITAIVGNAEAQTRLSFSTGIDYSSGNYGSSSDTNVTSVPLAARVANGDWAVRLSTSYLQIDGNANVADIVDSGGGGTGGGSTGTIARSGTARGIGDTTLAVTKSFTHLGHRGLYVDATGRVRFPTGDEKKGLGVGATDYALAGEIGAFQHGTGVYLNVARRFLGDRAGLDRQDGWQATLGGSLRVTEKTSLGASYYWRDASVSGGTDPSEASAYVAYRMTDALRVSLNAGAGLSNASPDTSVGLRFTWRPNAQG